MDRVPASDLYDVLSEDEVEEISEPATHSSSITATESPPSTVPSPRAATHDAGAKLGTKRASTIGGSSCVPLAEGRVVGKSLRLDRKQGVRMNSNLRARISNTDLVDFLAEARMYKHRYGVAVQDIYADAAEYYEHLKQVILAETFGSLQEAAASPSARHIACDVRLAWQHDFRAFPVSEHMLRSLGALNGSVLEVGLNGSNPPVKAVVVNLRNAFWIYLVDDDAHVVPDGMLAKGHVSHTSAYLGDRWREWGVCTVRPESKLLQDLLGATSNPSQPAHTPDSGCVAALSALNTSQRDAIQASLGMSCCTHLVQVVQGPPGTGKTHTLRALLEIACVNLSDDAVILVSAPTNKACQILASAFRQTNRSIPIALAGTSKKLPKDVAALTNIFVHGKGKHFADAVDASEDGQWRKVGSKALEYMKAWTPEALEGSGILNGIGSGRCEGWPGDFKTELVSRLRALDDDIEAELLQRAKVIFMTLSTLSRPKLRSMALQEGARRVQLAVVDEAGQAAETQMLPLLPWLPERLTLVGDTKQLSVSAVSTEGQRLGFGRSLMERLEKRGSGVRLLDLQYRMHAEISRFPLAHFYAGLVRDGPSLARGHGPSSPEEWLANGCFGPPPPYVLVDVRGEESRKGTSWSNRSEAQLCVALAARILGTDEHRAMADDAAVYERQDLDWQLEAYKSGSCVTANERTRKKIAGQCCLLTFYVGQVEEMQEAARRQSLADAIQIHTVDSFQGSEADIVFVSCVRSNCKGRLGFVSDFHRLNVALTRAKKALFVMADVEFLKATGNADLSALVQDAEQRRRIVPAESAWKALYGDEAENPAHSCYPATIDLKPNLSSRIFRELEWSFAQEVGAASSHVPLDAERELEVKPKAVSLRARPERAAHEASDGQQDSGVHSAPSAPKRARLVARPSSSEATLEERLGQPLDALL